MTESLKASLTGKGSDLKSTLSGIADKADDVADNMGEAAASAEAFAGALSEVEDEADDAEQQVNELKNAVKGANRAFDRGILSAGGYATMLERIDDADIDVDFDEDDVPGSGDYNGRSVHSVGFKLQDTDRLRRKTEEVDDKLKSVTDEVVPRIRLLGYQSSMSKLSRLKAKLEQIDDKVATARVMVTGDDDVDVPATRMVRGYGGGGEGPSGPSAPPRPARAFHGDAFENVAQRIAQADKYAPGSETPPGDEPRDAARAFHGADPFEEYARIFANHDDYAWAYRRAEEMGIGADGSYGDSSFRERIFESSFFDRGRQYRGAAKNRNFRKLAELLSGSKGSFGEAFAESFKDVFDPEGKFFGRAAGGDGDGGDGGEGGRGRDGKDGEDGEDGEDGRDGRGRGIFTSIGDKVSNKLGGLWEGLAKTSVNLGPFNTKVGTAVKIIPILIGLLGSLATAFSGLAIAALGVGAVLGGALAGGLLLAGKRADQASSEVEGTMEGIKKYLSGFKDEAMAAIEPLMTLENLNLMEGFLKGGISMLQQFSKLVNRLMGPVSAMVDRLASQFWQQQPTFFLELEKTVLAFLPVIESLVSWMMTASIEGMRFMREEGVKTIGFFLDFMGALFDIVVAVTDVSNALIRLFGPTVIGGLKVLANVSQNVASVLVPAMNALAWAVNGVVKSPFGDIAGKILTIAGTGYVLYSIVATLVGWMGTLAGWVSTAAGSLGGLSGILSGLSTVLSYVASAVVYLISGLAGIIGWPATIALAIAGLITAFGLWDDIMNVIMGTLEAIGNVFDFLVGGVATAIKSFASWFGMGDEAKAFLQTLETAFNKSVGWIVDKIMWMVDVMMWGWDKVAGFFDWAAMSTDEWVGRQFDNTKGSGRPKKQRNMPKAKDKFGGKKGNKGGGPPQDPTASSGRMPQQRNPYAGNTEVTVNNPQSPKAMEKRVREAMQKSVRYDRRAGSPHN